MRSLLDDVKRLEEDNSSSPLSQISTAKLRKERKRRKNGVKRGIAEQGIVNPLTHYSMSQIKKELRRRKGRLE